MNHRSDKQRDYGVGVCLRNYLPRNLRVAAILIECTCYFLLLFVAHVGEAAGSRRSLGGASGKQSAHRVPR